MDSPTPPSEPQALRDLAERITLSSGEWEPIGSIVCDWPSIGDGSGIAAALRAAADALDRAAQIEAAAQRAERWFTAVAAAERAELALGIRDALRTALAATTQPSAGEEGT